MKYQTKPVQVEAIQWNGAAWEVEHLERLERFKSFVMDRLSATYVRAEPEFIYVGGGVSFAVPIGEWLVYIGDSGPTLKRYEVLTDDDFNNKYKECE